MFNRNFLFVCFVTFVLLAGTAFAAVANSQCFTNENLLTWNRDDVAGGKGTLYGQFSFNRNQATKDQAIKEIGWMTLHPGASIGMHKHAGNEDAYIIISGEGIFTDSDGNETFVKAGDITIARAGQSHALRNDGKEPLRFLDVVAQNDGAPK